MVPVVRQRSVNLRQREMRMLALHLFGAVPEGPVFHHEVDYS